MIRGFGSPWVQELSSYMREKASAARASGRGHDLPEWISSKVGGRPRARAPAAGKSALSSVSIAGTTSGEGAACVAAGR